MNFPVAMERIHTQLSLKEGAAWDWNLADDTMHFSPRWSDVLALDHDQWCWTAQAWLARVHPDDAERVSAVIAAHVNGDGPYFEIEHRMRRDTGGWCSMVTRGLGVRGSDGRMTRLVGWVTPVADARAEDPDEVRPSRAVFFDRIRRAIGRSTAPVRAASHG